MQYVFTADTDVGIAKNVNQDSVLVKHGKYEESEVLMAIVCDGMGGLANGELASATVIRTFNEWFNKELPTELENIDMPVIGSNWSLLLKSLNRKISEYAKLAGERMGTTFTGLLCVGDQYVAVHVGDSRLYRITKQVKQLTTDQTFVAREVARGKLTPEQAKIDKRRNMLLQCVGASPTIEPEILLGTVEPGTYILCSDGFRHEISELEIYDSLNPINLDSKETMHINARYLIDLVKQRREKDNISVVLIKAN